MASTKRKELLRTALTRVGILLILPALAVVAICAEIRQKLLLDR
jgi:hypothetical protein